ncbi:MAG: FhaA domain-containing protein [Chloroflexota bacterium]|nr:FhaA domain-containing protein [Chloroflexota bacterium]
MNDHHLARLEAQLERLIEGAFAHVFSRSIRAQDIILQLARAIAAGVQSGNDGDPRQYAPDRFQIHLHPNVRAELLQRLPELETTLGRHVVALASEAGYRLRNLPTVQLIADAALLQTGIDVRAEHQARVSQGTARLERVDSTPATPLMLTAAHAARNPQLVINGEETIMLTDAILNVGRSRDNQLMLDDPRISRHHTQFRQRGGVFWVFDTNSSSGTYVNNVAVREHALQPGDVVRIGGTQLVYLEDESSDPDVDGTMPLSP